MQKIVTDTAFWEPYAINCKGRWSKANLEYDDIVIARENDLSIFKILFNVECNYIAYSGREYSYSEGKYILPGCFSEIFINIDTCDTFDLYPITDFACVDEPTPILIEVISKLTNANYKVKTFSKIPFPDYRNNCGQIEHETKLEFLANSHNVITSDIDFAAKLWASGIQTYITEDSSFGPKDSPFHLLNNRIIKSVGEIEKMVSNNTKNHSLIKDFILKNRNKEACFKEMIKTCLNISV